MVQGTHNGDQHCHEPNNAPWHSAYHGLVRAVIRVTGTSARSARERELLARIDLDGPMAAGVTTPATEDIVVEATSEGLGSVRITIPVSTDAASDGVMAVARAGAGKPVNFFPAASTAVAP